MKKSCATLFLALLLSALPAFAAAASPQDTAEIKNHALEADAIYASSEYSRDYAASFVADGIVRRQDMRLPNWMTNYEPEGTLTLTWDTEQVFTHAVFYDIASTDIHIAGGTMTFDTGKTVTIPALLDRGFERKVEFSEPIRAKSVAIHVTAASGSTAAGLSEVEFYNEEGVNVAPLASASADSEAYDGNPYWFIPVTYEGWYAASNAVNGWADSMLPKDTAENEWASLGESLPEITLSWNEPITVGTVVLCDRVSSDDFVWSGEIIFDEGDPIPFDSIDNFGDPLYVDIPDITTSKITVSVTESSGPNIGFAEIEVYTEHISENGKLLNPDSDLSADDPDGLITDTPAELPDVGILSIVLCALFAVFLLLAVLSAVRSKKESAA